MPQKHLCLSIHLAEEPDLTLALLPAVSAPSVYHLLLRSCGVTLDKNGLELARSVTAGTADRLLVALLLVKITLAVSQLKLVGSCVQTSFILQKTLGISFAQNCIS